MKALIEIQGGPEKGRQFWVKGGMTMGRRRADIVIEDPKISGTHAEIAFDNNELEICDKNSTHGLWNPSQRVPKVKLKEGLLFKLGDTLFKVAELKISFSQLVLQEISAGLKRSPLPDRRWPQWTYEPFPHLLHLEFLQGAHEGEKWPLGYGPRTVGLESLDLMILDPAAKPECFRLHSQEGKISVLTEHDDFLQVNGRFVREAELNSDDLISFGETIIKVRWNS